MSDSLFGHLALRFASKPENLATEALCYVLERYPSAANAFVGFLQHMGVKLHIPIKFKTQPATPEGSIPDLVGTDPEGRRVFIVEAKFWAGLTEHQPVTYIKELPQDSPSVLLFIAPRLRFTTLWPELLERCKAASLPVKDETVATGEARYRKIGDQHLLALASWRAILVILLEALEAEGNQAGAADVRQIQGLSERMDSQAFLPLCSEELSPQIARRTMQYCQLIDEIMNTMQNQGIGVWKRIGYDISRAALGRYVLIGNNGCYIHFNPDLWARIRSTPLWLLIQGENWEKPITASTIEALGPLEHEDPPRLVRDGSDVLVPLSIPLSVEHDTVVSSLANQICEVASLLRKASSGGASAA